MRQRALRLLLRGGQRGGVCGSGKGGGGPAVVAACRGRRSLCGGGCALWERCGAVGVGNRRRAHRCRGGGGGGSGGARGRGDGRGVDTVGGGRSTASSGGSAGKSNNAVEEGGTAGGVSNSNSSSGRSIVGGSEDAINGGRGAHARARRGARVAIGISAERDAAKSDEGGGESAKVSV